MSRTESTSELLKGLIPKSVRLWAPEELEKRYAELVIRPDIEIWTPPESVDSILKAGGASWAEMGGLPVIIAEGGPKRLVLIASPHADEPVGVATALAALEGWLDPQNATLRKQVSLAIVPMANPQGYTENSTWFAEANALEAAFEAEADGPVERYTPDILNKPALLAVAETALAAYLIRRRRSLPEDDVEFGYAPPEASPVDPAADFLPPCRVHAASFRHLADRWGTIDAFVPLHSMGTAGGAWALLRVPPNEADQPAPASIMAAYRAAAEAVGLPLHDEDRGGEKGFWRLGPGFHTTPTVEEMRAYFAPLTAKTGGETIKIRYNSMQYVGAARDDGGGARWACVPEVPFFCDPALADFTPLLDTTRREVLKRRAAASSEAAEILDSGAASSGEALDERANRQLFYWRRNADAFARQAESPGATETAQQREAARAYSDSVTRPILSRSLVEAESPALLTAARQLARQSIIEHGWRPVPIRVQIQLQLALALGTLNA